MKLDRTKIFSAVDADQVPIGARCVFGDSITQLENKFNSRMFGVLNAVKPEDKTYRFVSEDKVYSLAYIVDYEAEDYMERFNDLCIGTRLLMKEEYNDGDVFIVMVTGYDRKTLRFYAAGKWYNAEDLCMFEEPTTE